ncbi:octopamine receptor beta-2R-like [Diadema antillarum]|uniref:octopamine receptor beta-2R-like n=1 Tax=Diadema antillarum TaxID=105358 RepID=UPI003A8B079A
MQSLTSLNGTRVLEEQAEETGSSVTVVNIFQLIFGSLGIVGNLLCIVVFKRRSKQNQTNFLIIMQAAVDMVASGFLVVLTITTILPVSAPSPWVFGTIYCIIWKSSVLLWASFAISTFNLTIISIERYIAVVHPMQYTSLFKRSSTMFMVACTWFVAPSINIAYNGIVNEYHGKCTEVFNRPRTVLSITLFFWEYFFPICVMIFSFLSIAYKLLKMNRVSDLLASSNMTEHNQSSTMPSPSSFVDNQQNQPCPGGANQARLETNTKATPDGVPARDSLQPPSISLAVKQPVLTNAGTPRTVREGTRRSGASVRRLKITKVLLLVSLGYIICWSPNQWYFLLVNLKVINLRQVPYRVTVIMSTCNTCLNPFIYALQMKNFRDDVRACFRCLSR